MLQGTGRLQFPNSAAALAASSGELCFWYWLTRCDGFHVTGWLLSDFLLVLKSMPESHHALLTDLGQSLVERRFESLVFKKNAGKYIGNFNYRNMPELTRRADLLVLAGLNLGRDDALSVFDYVQRVLSINESAGEKGIPPLLKQMYPPLPVDQSRQTDLFERVDQIVAAHFGFSADELDFIINRDAHHVLVGESTGVEVLRT